MNLELRQTADIQSGGANVMALYAPELRGDAAGQRQPPGHVCSGEVRL